MIFQNPSAETRLRLLTAVLVSVTAGMLLVSHAPGFNGPAYWQWPWQRLAPFRLFGLMALGMIPFAAAQYLFYRRKGSLPFVLILLMAAAVLLQVVAAGVQTRPFDLSRIGQIVAHQDCTSYFYDATILRGQRGVLRFYPQLMEYLSNHSRTKPPGMILFYIGVMKVLGSTFFAAMAAGFLICFLAAGSVPATFFLLRGLGAGTEAAFAGAGCMTLCSGIILFVPQYDQCLPILTAVLTGLWMRALRRNRIGYAFGFGLALSLTCFFTYNLLVLGFFIAGWTVLHAAEAGPGRVCAAALKYAAAAGAAAAAFYAALRMATGFDPFATFEAALKNQQLVLDTSCRPYSQAIIFDLWDLLLGTNWIVGLLALLFVAWKVRRPRDREFWTAVLCVAQILVVDLSGLLRVETARLWIFMYPFLIFPAALELCRWSFLQRMVFYFLMWALLTLTCQNMVFNVLYYQQGL